METANRLMNLPLRLSKRQCLWLEKMKKDNRDEVLEAAEYAYDLSFGAHLLESDYEEYDVPELTPEEIHGLFDE